MPSPVGMGKKSLTKIIPVLTDAAITQFFAPSPLLKHGKNCHEMATQHIRMTASFRDQILKFLLKKADTTGLKKPGPRNCLEKCSYTVAGFRIPDSSY